MSQPAPHEQAYPKSLRESEDALLNAGAHKRPSLGVALSGGGVRSATFALGVFQAWAKHAALRNIQFLSTVSGGGYFGAFYGRLFNRGYVRDVADAEWLLGASTAKVYPSGSITEPSEDLKSAKGHVLDWLREHGRYLAPRGTADLLLLGAGLLRNWLTIHVLVGLLVVLIMLLAQGPSVWADQDNTTWLLALAETGVDYARGKLPVHGSWLWWSPWTVFALVALAFAVPSSWAYWLVAQKGSHLGSVIGTVAVLALVAAGYSLSPEWAAPGLLKSAAALGVIAGLALIIYVVTRAVQSSGEGDLSRDAVLRNNLSAFLKNVLLVSAFFGALGVVDTLGRTLYALMASDQSGALTKWAVGVGTLFGVVATFARQAAVLVGSKADGKRLTLPLSVLAAVAAGVVVLLLATTYNVLAQAIVWKGAPANAPAALVSGAAPGGVKIEAPADATLTVVLSGATEAVSVQARNRIGLRPWGGWLVLVTVVAIVFGRNLTLANATTHQPLYSARLARAYLGASNARRWTRPSDGAPDAAVITPVAGDDTLVTEYWHPSDGATPHSKGAPLHLINVTINETIHGQSQVQQQDRRGLGLAVGPAALSAGRRHHLLHDKGIYQSSTPAPGQFRIFEYGNTKPAFHGELLTLSRWIGISGAAFSTGLGSRTSIGLSLLAGLTNVRLGYWWDSCIDMATRARFATKGRWPAAPLGRVFEWLVPVQKYVLSEWVARFPGVARPRWYLSDGGHFENMGAYELIRRRLKYIIIVDAEQDEAYQFSGLANLIRKARIDFGAEITFLGTEERTTLKLREPFGSLDDLRLECPPEKRDCEKDTLRYSKARFSVARVKYDDEPATDTHWLFYIKPTLLGNEPADVIEYARANAPFPNQTTADQFFDEAQWESYRMLGELVGGAFHTAIDGSDLGEMWALPKTKSGGGPGAPAAPTHDREEEERVIISVPADLIPAVTAEAT